MKKIAFVVIRYGIEVNGGAEVHCRMLAERLRPYYQVEVLTTTIKICDRPEEDYPEEEQMDNGVLVRRFKPRPLQGEQYDTLRRRSKTSLTFRRFIYKLGLLKYIAAIHPLWTLGAEAEERCMEAQPSHTPQMLQFIEQHQGEYSALIFMNYFFSQTILGSRIAPERTILIPLAHPARVLWCALQTQAFTRVRHIAFNTDAERRLCNGIFGPRMAPYSLVGAGTDPVPPAEWSEVKAQFGLPDQYALYLGRVTKEKVGTLLPDFVHYRQQNPEATLVVVGGIDAAIPPPDDPGIIFTGFVSEAQKSAIIRHATLMINPSIMESLSLLMLEAMECRIPVLVNGKCEVMKDHCLQSGAALYYNNRRDFRHKLHRLLTDPALRRELGDRGPAYVEQHYNWGLIIGKLRALIESL